MNKIDEMLGKIIHTNNSLQPRTNMGFRLLTPNITNRQLIFNPIRNFMFSDNRSKNKKNITAQSLIDAEVLDKLRTEFEKNPAVKVVPKDEVPLFSGLHPEYYVEKKVVVESNAHNEKTPIVKKHSILNDLMNRKR